MTGAAKVKGDRGEREAAALVADLTGVPATVLQVAAWADVARAAREKPAAAEAQRVNAGATFAATLVRFRGGTWRVVLTPEQWAAYVFNSQPEVAR